MGTATVLRREQIPALVFSARRTGFDWTARGERKGGGSAHGSRLENGAEQFYFVTGLERANSSQSKERAKKFRVLVFSLKREGRESSNSSHAATQNLQTRPLYIESDNGETNA